MVVFEALEGPTKAMEDDVFVIYHKHLGTVF